MKKYFFYYVFFDTFKIHLGEGNTLVTITGEFDLLQCINDLLDRARKDEPDKQIASLIIRNIVEL